MERALAPRKIATLSNRSLARYIDRLFAGADDPDSRSAFTNDPYVLGILEAVVSDEDRPSAVRLAASDVAGVLSLGDADATAERLARRVKILREALYPQEVTALPQAESATNAGRNPPPALPISIWIPHLRSPFNLGNIVRTAAAYGIVGVFTGEHAPSFDHPRCRRAAMGGQAIVTTGRADLARARELTGSGRRAAVDGAILVLETGGTAVEEFGFPESGVLVLGHEELGVPQEILRRAAGDRRVVTIPHEGDKRSLNVGVAAGICLSWWRVRRHPQE